MDRNGAPIQEEEVITRSTLATRTLARHSPPFQTEHVSTHLHDDYDKDEIKRTTA